LAVFAEGLAAIGQHTQALAAIERAIEWSNRTGECWYDAELYRIKGELILNASPAQFAAARICFRKGKLVARQQGALFWELRSAMSHARLIMRHDGLDDPRQELADVYNRFTEGFETTDLLAATAMLEAIAAAGWSPRNVHT
jgi:predicted ATPase